MSIVKPFRAVRPCDNETAELIAALPYDVYSRTEAKKAVEGKPLSFLNIDRPETFFADDQDMYAPEVYERAKEEYEKLKAGGQFLQEDRDAYYIYELTMDGRSQTGIVGAVAVSDYENGICRKHENTVAEKEEDRIRHVDTMSAQTGPIFLAFHANDRLNGFLTAAKSAEPLYDFVTEEGIGQRVWKIDDPEKTAFIEKCFQDVPNTYIADGHHRAASAVKVSKRRRQASENADASVKNSQIPESEYFLSVLFPDTELKIMDYNRIVRDLNGMSPKEFLARLKNESPYEVTRLDFSAKEEELNEYRDFRPETKHMVGMYLDGELYLLTLKDSALKEVEKDPVKKLDVSILQNTVLGPLLGIGDPRTDKRISFVGGIRGLKPLIDAVDEAEKEGRKAVSFAMFPTSMQELFDVADAHQLMPPKSTWFEPKLRSGLFIHEI